MIKGKLYIKPLPNFKFKIDSIEYESNLKESEVFEALKNFKMSIDPHIIIQKELF